MVEFLQLRPVSLEACGLFPRQRADKARRRLSSSSGERKDNAALGALLALKTDAGVVRNCVLDALRRQGDACLDRNAEPASLPAEHNDLGGSHLDGPVPIDGEALAA